MLVKMNCANAAGGGVSEFEVLSGKTQLTTSAGYDFTDDYKYVICITYGGNNLQLFRINGEIPSTQMTSQGNKSLVGDAYPTEAILYTDIKNGDQLRLGSGTYVNVTILGMN